MIGEALILGTSLLGCVGCWTAVARHRISAELQKHKITTDYESIKPVPEPPRPEPTPAQQALTALLARRKNLEDHVTSLRSRVADNSHQSYKDYRADAIKVLEDARTEQQELVLEETGLLEMMHGVKDGKVDSASKSIRVDTGGPVAERVDDSGELHAAELHDEETGRESTA